MAVVVMGNLDIVRSVGSSMVAPNYGRLRR